MSTKYGYNFKLQKLEKKSKVTYTYKKELMELLLRQKLIKHSALEVAPEAFSLVPIHSLTRHIKTTLLWKT